MITNMLHFGMVVVGLPYSFAGQMTLDEITGGSPYGASTITGGQGERMPSANELEAARFQGRLVAETAARLAGDVPRGAEISHDDAEAWEDAQTAADHRHGEDAPPSRAH